MALLTAMLKQKPKRPTWTAATNKAFCRLKHAFTITPILHYPDPKKLCVVEEDALEYGVGAVLSQRFGEKVKLYPGAYFSRKLSPAE